MSDPPNPADPRIPPAPPAPDREIELKLLFPAERVSRLRRHPLVMTHTIGRALTRTLRSDYFDTPSLDLAEAGVALRVRQVGRRFVQTVKTRGSGHAGLFSRTELEAAVDGEQPNLEAVADLGLRRAIETLRRGAPLAPVVTTEFRRTQRRLDFRGSELLFDLDLGEVRCARGSAPIAELELELVRGRPETLYALALELLETVDLRPATLGKADRGFAILRGELPQARKASKISHPAGATLSEVIDRIVGSALEQIVHNEAVACEGIDAEGVHQMRVGLRRLRAGISLFRRVLPTDAVVGLEAEVRWLARELGFVRDLDVFLAETLEPLAARSSQDAGLKRLRDDGRELRDANQRHLREHLGSPRYRRLILELGRWHAAQGWLDQPLSETGALLYQDARSHGRAMLTRLHRKARKLGRRLDEQSIEEKHRLRIHLKKLRYSAEFLISLFDTARGKKYVAHLAELQDVLGHLNDVATARRLLDELSEWMGPDAPNEAHRAAGLVEGWTARGAERELEKLYRRFRLFSRTKPFWE